MCLWSSVSRTCWTFFITNTAGNCPVAKLKISAGVTKCHGHSSKTSSSFKQILKGHHCLGSLLNHIILVLTFDNLDYLKHSECVFCIKCLSSEFIHSCVSHLGREQSWGRKALRRSCRISKTWFSSRAAPQSWSAESAPSPTLSSSGTRTAKSWRTAPSTATCSRTRISWRLWFETGFWPIWENTALPLKTHLEKREDLLVF